MFEVDFNDWIEDVSKDVLKISEGIYAERKPFADLISFCKIFQLLYWDCLIHEIEVAEKERIVTLNKLSTIFKEQ